MFVGSGSNSGPSTSSPGCCCKKHQELVCEGAQDQSHLSHAEPVQPRCDPEVSDCGMLGACSGLGDHSACSKEGNRKQYLEKLFVLCLPDSLSFIHRIKNVWCFNPVSKHRGNFTISCLPDYKILIYVNVPHSTTVFYSILYWDMYIKIVITPKKLVNRIGV